VNPPLADASPEARVVRCRPAGLWPELSSAAPLTSDIFGERRPGGECGERRANESDENFLYSDLTPLLQNATEVLRGEEKSVAYAMDRKWKLFILFFGTTLFPVLWIEFSLLLKSIDFLTST